MLWGEIKCCCCCCCCYTFYSRNPTCGIPQCLRISHRKYPTMPKEFHNREPPLPFGNPKSRPWYSMDIFWNRPLQVNQHLKMLWVKSVLRVNQNFIVSYTDCTSAWLIWAKKDRKFWTNNLGQNCWENCILGQHFSKHRTCTGSSLSPFPWKQCCCVFKRKPDPWAFVGSNIGLGEGVFLPQRRRFGNSFVAQESGHDGENFLK